MKAKIILRLIRGTRLDYSDHVGLVEDRHSWKEMLSNVFEGIRKQAH